MTGMLPSWAKELFPIGAEGGSQPVYWRLTTDWPWPTAWYLLLAVCVGAVVVLCTLKDASHCRPGARIVLCGLRLVALGLLLAMLTGLVIDFYTTSQPIVAVVVDHSQSMATTDADAGSSTRLEVAKNLLYGKPAGVLQLLPSTYGIRVYTVASDWVLHDGNADDVVDALSALDTSSSESRSSRLGDVLRAITNASDLQRPAAVVMFTDGRVTSGSSLAAAADAARAQRVPLYFVGVGSDAHPRDVELRDVVVDEQIFLGDSLLFQVHVSASGLEGQSGKLSLRAADVPQQLAAAELLFSTDDEYQTIQLAYRPTETGKHDFIIDVKSDEAEVNVTNNRVERTVVVSEKTIDVLLANAQPSYEYRYLKTMLERDPSFALTTYLQQSSTDFEQIEETARAEFPTRSEIFEYDVIVFGDMDPQYVPRTAWQNLADFVVKRGGGLVLIAGESFLPWAYQAKREFRPLLPFPTETRQLSVNPLATDRGFRVTPTALGRVTPFFELGDSGPATRQIWKQLPQLYWFSVLPPLRPNVRVLAKASHDTAEPAGEQPLIVSYFVGAGEVLFHATDETWRWRRRGGERHFGRYWKQAIRHLAKGTLASDEVARISTDRLEYEEGETALVRARFPDRREAQNVEVVITHNGEDQRQLHLDRHPLSTTLYECRLQDLRRGTYDVMLARAERTGDWPRTTFRVRASNRELENVRYDRSAMMAAADRTQGRYYSQSDVAALIADLPHGTRRSIASLPPQSLWNHPLLLAMFLLVVVCEWIWRRRCGLL